MKDPLETFEEVYRSWEPRPRPKVGPNPLVIWPALAAAATILFLFLCQASPVDQRREQPYGWARLQVQEAGRDGIDLSDVVRKDRA